MLNSLEEKKEILLKNGEILRDFVKGYLIRLSEVRPETKIDNDILENLDLSKNATLVYILYEVLKYPILWFTPTGVPSTGAAHIRSLSEALGNSGYPISFENDLIGCNGEVLINSNHLNSLRYPIASCIVLFKTMEKELKTFLLPLSDKLSSKKMDSFTK